MTQIEISRKLAQDAGLDPKAADAIVQAVAEYTETAAPVSKEHFDDQMTLLRADLDKKLAELRSFVDDKLRDQTHSFYRVLTGLVVLAILTQHYWR